MIKRLIGQLERENRALTEQILNGVSDYHSYSILLAKHHLLEQVIAMAKAIQRSEDDIDA